MAQLRKLLNSIFVSKKAWDKAEQTAKNIYFISKKYNYTMHKFTYKPLILKLMHSIFLIADIKFIGIFSIIIYILIITNYFIS